MGHNVGVGAAFLVSALLLVAGPDAEARPTASAPPLEVVPDTSPCEFGFFGTSIRFTERGPAPRENGRRLVVDCGESGAWQIDAANIELLFSGDGKSFLAVARNCRYCDVGATLFGTLYEGRLEHGRLVVSEVSGHDHFTEGRIGRLPSGALVFMGDAFVVFREDGQRCVLPRIEGGRQAVAVDVSGSTCRELLLSELPQARFLASAF